MKFCEACGAPLKEDAIFCENCGTLVPTEANVQADKKETFIENHQDQSVEDEGPFNEAPSTEQLDALPNNGDSMKPPTNGTEGKKSGSFLAALGLLVIFGVGGFLWWQSQGSEQATVATAESSTIVASSSSSETTDTRADSSEESTVESSTETTMESTTEPLEDFNVTDAATITQTALAGLSGNFGVVLSPVERNDLAYMQGENQPIRAASVIKLFIMAAVYDQVDRGRLTLGQEYTLSGDDVVGGTGVLQNYPEGHVLSFDQLVYHMIVDSDNTAGNILIQNLGGLSPLNDYLRSNGFSGTVMNRLFLDTNALNSGRDNYTTAKDVARLLQNIYQHQMVSPIYDQAMLDLLQQNKNRSKLPAQIGSEVVVYNKTGEYADYGVENDACIFEKDGKAYVVVVLSDDGQSREQILAMNALGEAFYETYMRSE